MAQERSPEHQAAIDDLERSLGPFDDPDWRDELALLEISTRSAAVQWAVDARILSALAARVPRFPGDDRGGTPWTSFAREIAVARKIGDTAAHAEIALSCALVERHPNTLRLLGAGQVPAHRARVLVQECLGHTDDVVAAVEAGLAERLASLTPSRIGQEIAGVALRLDAAAAARKEAIAAAGRTARKRGLADAQAEIVLTGPAVVVQRWWDALTERARALKAAGDPRNLGALRFDLAVTSDPASSDGHDLLLAALGLAVRPDPTDASAGRGGGTGPARPGPPSTSRPTRTPSDDARCSRPVQAQITVPAATALGLGDEPGWVDGHGWISAPQSRQLLTTAELRKACVAPHSGQLVDLADRVVRPRLTPDALREAVRTMVLTPHELRSLVTDEQAKHDPSPALQGFVQDRDRFCDGPTGAQVAARRTDTDHDRSWPTGPTAAANLVSRAGRTHQLKHFGWTAVRDGTGTRWTSPAHQVVHSPSWHHPPDPPTRPDLPSPHDLARSDIALVHPPSWAGCSDLPGHDDERTAGPALPDVQARNGWPDEPPF